MSKPSEETRYALALGPPSVPGRTRAPCIPSWRALHSTSTGAKFWLVWPGVADTLCPAAAGHTWLTDLRPRRRDGRLRGDDLVRRSDHGQWPPHRAPVPPRGGSQVQLSWWLLTLARGDQYASSEYSSPAWSDYLHRCEQRVILASCMCSPLHAWKGCISLWLLFAIYYIWYGDKWDTTSTDYNATPKILTGASPCSRHSVLGCLGMMTAMSVLSTLDEKCNVIKMACCMLCRHPTSKAQQSVCVQKNVPGPQGYLHAELVVSTSHENVLACGRNDERCERMLGRAAQTWRRAWATRTG